MKTSKNTGNRTWVRLVAAILAAIGLLCAFYFITGAPATSSVQQRPQQTQSKEDAAEEPAEEPLYIIDGEEVEPFDKFHKKTSHILLKSLTAEEAIAQYGERGKNGVVIITSLEPLMIREFVEETDESAKKNRRREIII